LRNFKDKPFFRDQPDIARSGLQSYASHPVSSFGQVVGFLSVMHTDDFALGESDKEALALFASAIGIEEERRKNEQTIRRRLEFESMVSTISSRFVGTADIDVAIESSLSDIGIFSRTDRTYAVLFDNDKLTMSNTYEWCAEGVSPQIATLKSLPCSTFSWWMAKLKNHEVIRIQDVSALPEEAKSEKEMLRQQRVRSSLMLPVYVGNQLAGFVGFNNVSARAQWDDYDTALLQLVSEIFGRVLEGQMAKDSLRKSEEKMRAIFESLAEGITVTDLQGNITQVNAAAIRMHGYYSPEEVIGKSAFEFLKGEERDRAFRNMKRTLQEGSLTSVQYTAIKNDGSELPVELSASVMLDNNGNPFGFVWVTKDITERVEAEEARRRLEAQKMVVEKLKELDRAKNDFVEIVAHELRTPMTPLRSAIELLLEGTYGHLSRNQRELLEMIARNVERVTRFTTEVLSLSRLEAGKYSLHPDQISLLTSIQPAVDLLKRNAQRNGISVSTDTELEICAFADPDAVSEVVTNLVSNAIAHCPAGTQVTVSAKLLNDNFAEISVADNGPGIAKEDADRLFEKFYQISRKSGSGYKGTGIGLALCKRLVEAMGGEITVESRPGEGTVFRFVLPTKPAARGYSISRLGVSA
jgi:PAS domain S-box-containing protein